MIKRYLTTIFFLFLAVLACGQPGSIKTGIAQIKTEQTHGDHFANLGKGKPDTIRLEIVLKLMLHYYFSNAGDTRKNMDTAFLLLQQAKNLSDEIIRKMAA